MEGAQVRKGFSLVEVMVALCLLMVSALAFFRMHVVCIQARAYGENLTRASVLGSSCMAHLGSLPSSAPELTPQWHQDPGNPIMDSGVPFYRFWIIRETPRGRDATVYVAWTDRPRGRAADFVSEEQVASASCPKISFRELLLTAP